MSEARTRILDAAEAIVQARGVPSLTIEAAAAEAGVSKGGLLYHFRSKEALLTGMLDRAATLVETDWNAAVEAMPPGPGQAARACLAWGFDVEDCGTDRTAAVLMAAFHHDPALVDPIRAVLARMRARLADDGLPPGVALVVLAAVDGLFLGQLFSTWLPTPEERATMRGVLERLICAAD